MFLEGYSAFAQIGVVVSILVASLFFCVILQACQVLWYLFLPFRFCFRMCSNCECRDKNGEPIDTTADWDDYAFRCPCVGDDEDEAFKV